MSPKNNNSGIAGFIDGYIANNIETNAASLKFYSNELSQLLDNLKSDITKNYTDQSFQNINSYIEKAKNSLVIDIDIHNPSEAVDAYLQSELSFDEFMNNINIIKPEKKPETAQLLKKIVFQYLNIAKQAPDSRIENAAIQIANKYDKYYK